MVREIMEKTKEEAEIIKNVVKKKKIAYGLVFALPLVGAIASAGWIAYDYYRHKKNNHGNS